MISRDFVTYVTLVLDETVTFPKFDILGEGGIERRWRILTPLAEDTGILVKGSLDHLVIHDLGNYIGKFETMRRDK